MSRDNSPPFSMDDFEGKPAFLKLLWSEWTHGHICEDYYVGFWLYENYLWPLYTAVFESEHIYMNLNLLIIGLRLIYVLLLV